MVTLGERIVERRFGAWINRKRASPKHYDGDEHEKQWGLQCPGARMKRSQMLAIDMQAKTTKVALARCGGCHYGHVAH